MITISIIMQPVIKSLKSVECGQDNLKVINTHQVLLMLAFCCFAIYKLNSSPGNFTLDTATKEIKAL